MIINGTVEKQEDAIPVAATAEREMIPKLTQGLDWYQRSNIHLMRSKALQSTLKLIGQ